jgi:hypothetical protein
MTDNAVPKHNTRFSTPPSSANGNPKALGKRARIPPAPGA